MNSTTRNLHEINLNKEAESKGITLQWAPHVCTLRWEGRRYLVNLIGNWPERVLDRIEWFYNTHIRPSEDKSL